MPSRRYARDLDDDFDMDIGESHKSNERKLMRWDEDSDYQLLLAIDYQIKSQKIKLDWNAVARLLPPPCTGGACEQHLAKLRKKREDQMLPIPPKLPPTSRFGRTTARSTLPVGSYLRHRTNNRIQNSRRYANMHDEGSTDDESGDNDRHNLAGQRQAKSSQSSAFFSGYLKDPPSRSKPMRVTKNSIDRKPEQAVRKCGKRTSLRQKPPRMYNEGAMWDEVTQGADIFGSDNAEVVHSGGLWPNAAQRSNYAAPSTFNQQPTPKYDQKFSLPLAASNASQPQNSVWAPIGAHASDQLGGYGDPRGQQLQHTFTTPSGFGFAQHFSGQEPDLGQARMAASGSADYDSSGFGAWGVSGNSSSNSTGGSSSAIDNMTTTTTLNSEDFFPIDGVKAEPPFDFDSSLNEHLGSPVMAQTKPDHSREEQLGDGEADVDDMFEQAFKDFQQHQHQDLGHLWDGEGFGYTWAPSH